MNEYLPVLKFIVEIFVGVVNILETHCGGFPKVIWSSSSKSIGAAFIWLKTKAGQDASPSSDERFFFKQEQMFIFGKIPLHRWTLWNCYGSMVNILWAVCTAILRIAFCGQNTHYSLGIMKDRLLLSTL